MPNRSVACICTCAYLGNKEKFWINIFFGIKILLQFYFWKCLKVEDILKINYFCKVKKSCEQVKSLLMTKKCFCHNLHTAVTYNFAVEVISVHKKIRYSFLISIGGSLCLQSCRNKNKEAVKNHTVNFLEHFMGKMAQ